MSAFISFVEKVVKGLFIDSFGRNSFISIHIYEYFHNGNKTNSASITLLKLWFKLILSYWIKYVLLKTYYSILSSQPIIPRRLSFFMQFEQIRVSFVVKSNFDLCFQVVPHPHTYIYIFLSILGSIYENNFKTPQQPSWDF